MVALSSCWSASCSSEVLSCSCTAAVSVCVSSSVILVVSIVGISAGGGATAVDASAVVSAGGCSGGAGIPVDEDEVDGCCSSVGKLKVA